MSQDLRKSLLTNKNAPFQKLYEECLIKIQRIKQKNDFMQRQIGGEMEDSISQEIKKQRDFLQHQIQEIKELMDQIQNRFKDPESKNKLKTIKSEAQKQIQRNKIIMKDLITKSFMNRSRGSIDNNDDQGSYMMGGQVNYDNLGYVKQNKSSMITDRSQEKMKQEQLDIDYQLERKIMKEKKELLQIAEQTNQRVNEIMNDMALEVHDQGQNLDIISDQLMNAHRNVENTNQALDDAAKYQKKSRKKYVILIIIIILIVAAVVGVVFITRS